MPKKKIQVELDGKAVDATVVETTTENAVPKTRTRKSPRAVFVAKITGVEKTLADIATPKYSSVGEDFAKFVEDARVAMNAASALARELPEDWKPGTGTRNGKRNGKLAIGDFVKAKEKHLDSFTEMEIGNGPFKVFGVLPSAKMVKIEIPEGSTCVPLKWVERVAVASAE